MNIAATPSLQVAMRRGTLLAAQLSPTDPSDMRILLVAPQPFYQERGTPIAVRILVETLCLQGHTVDLLCYHEGRDLEIEGLRILRTPPLPGIRNIPVGI